MPTIPPEILIEILGYLEPKDCEIDRHTVAACCLASTSFLQPARDLLYRQVTIACYCSHTSLPYGPRPFARELVIIEEEDDLYFTPVVWGLAARSSGEAILARPHLAARVRTISFDFGGRHQGAYMDNQAEDYLEEEEGWSVEKTTFELVEEVFQACPFAHSLRVTDGPDFALQGLARQLRVTTGITSLEIDIQDEYGYPRPAAPFAAICKSLPALKHLVYGGVIVRTHAWKVSGLFSDYALETLSMAYNPEALIFLLGRSNSSLTHLRLSWYRPTPTLDLRRLTSLKKVELESMESDLAPASPSRFWIPPSPSQMTSLFLSPLPVDDSTIPEIPQSVQHLTLQLQGPRDGRPLPPDTDYPIFATLTTLLYSLIHLKTFCIAPFSLSDTLKTGGYTSTSRELLHSLCAEKGIELEDGAAKLVAKWEREEKEGQEERLEGQSSSE